MQLDRGVHFGSSMLLRSWTDCGLGVCHDDRFLQVVPWMEALPGWGVAAPTESRTCRAGWVRLLLIFCTILLQMTVFTQLCGNRERSMRCLMHWRLYWNAACSLDMKMLLASHSKELVTNVESMDVLDSPLPIPHYILGKWCSNTFSGLYVRFGSDKWLSKDFHCWFIRNLTAGLRETCEVKWHVMIMCSAGICVTLLLDFDWLEVIFGYKLVVHLCFYTTVNGIAFAGSDNAVCICSWYFLEDLMGFVQKQKIFFSFRDALIGIFGDQRSLWPHKTPFWP